MQAVLKAVTAGRAVIKVVAVVKVECYFAIKASVLFSAI